MTIEGFNVRLIDDGTLDTVLSVDGCQHRYDQDFASEYRDPANGALTTDGFYALAEDAIDTHAQCLGDK